MKKLVIYIHGREGLPSEAEHYVKLFPGKVSLVIETKYLHSNILTSIEVGIFFISVRKSV